MRYILIMSALLGILFADEVYKETDWGIGMVGRHASVPFKNPDPTAPPTDTSVTSAVPFLFYDSKYFFLNGIEGGIKAYEDENWRFSALSRLRFVDIPKGLQNEHQLDTFDFGIQARYRLAEHSYLDTELLSDTSGHYYANLSYRGEYEIGDFDLRPYGTLRLKSDRFNTLYYALEQEDIKMGLDYTAGVNARYHVVSNLYLLAGAQVRLLDKAAKEAAVVADGYEYSTYVGVGLFNDKTETSRKTLGITPYLRLSHGWATHSDIDQILGGNLPIEPYNNQYTSIFFGYPLADRLFTLPIDIYLTPGFAWHHSSEVQDNLREYILAIKAYYTIPLPIRFRFGAAEGISYINEVTYIEKTDVNEDGFQESQVLNYLDFSLDVNVGDLFFTESMQKAWFGVNIHHRSGIFSYSSQFGRVTGGSNYPSVHLQLDF